MTDFKNLIEITCDSVLKAKFEKVSVFGGNLIKLYEKLSKQSYARAITVCIYVLMQIRFFVIFANKDKILC